MKILKLKLRGAIGIMKGLGVEEIEIDFSQFEPGLIAITGRNGSGKTSLIENMHPYRCMVSRNGSLQSHFFLKDSYRVLDFEHEGTLFRSQIYIDALTGGSEAYLFTYPNGYDGTANSLNDGKLTTYDLEIEKLLGSQELFFNSVFSGQKSKGIAELKPADRRKLFYELLNLDVYESYLEDAKAELKSNEIRLSATEGQINALQTDEQNLDELNELIKNLTGSKDETERKINALEKSIAQIETEIKQSEAELIKLQEKMKTGEEAMSKLNSLGAKISDLNEATADKREALDSDIDAAKEKIKRNEKLIANKENIKDKISDINKALIEHRSLESERSDLQSQLTDIQNKYRTEFEKLNIDYTEIGKVEANLKDLENKYDKNSDEMERIENDSKIIDQVPCGNKDSMISKYDFSKCQFLLKAYEGRDKYGALDNYKSELVELIKEASAEHTEKLAKWKADKTELENKNTAEVETLQTKINELNSSIEALQVELDELNKTDWNKLKSECDEAENNIKLLNQKLESAMKQLADLGTSHNDRLKELTDEIDELKKKIDPDLNRKYSEVNQSLDQSEDKKELLQESLTEHRTSLTDLNEAISLTNQKIETAKANRLKINELDALKQFIQSEIKDWTFLVKAFDKTGIPVLKLENSGIEITSIANELLSFFENKFRIVFETTALKKDKKSVKETFDINIVEDDGVTEIANKSGGQQVYLETALRLAISHVVKQQGKNIQTSFLDEADGALDLNNAVNYMEMIKRSHEMSGVHNTFVITHRTELLDLIPQQVKLTDGYLQIINN